MKYNAIALKFKHEKRSNDKGQVLHISSKKNKISPLKNYWPSKMHYKIGVHFLFLMVIMWSKYARSTL